MVKGVIVPYFRERKIKLTELAPSDIQDFYTAQLQRVKPNSVIHYHANIHKALKYAVKTDLIPSSPADKVDRPRKNIFVGSFYDTDELNRLFEVARGTKIELGVLLGAFYGLRRSEIIGLKWDAIDFKQNSITIKRTVVSCNVDGKHIEVESEKTKNKSSMRTLPLVPEFRERLLTLWQEQEENRKLCGRSYTKKHEDYIYVNELGERIKPGYITWFFPQLLERNELRRIRFHDLRHSCASLLLAAGVPMKQIQEWLGHSNISTTADIYAHLDFNSKVSSANALRGGLQLQTAH